MIIGNEIQPLLSVNLLRRLSKIVKVSSNCIPILEIPLTVRISTLYNKFARLFSRESGFSVLRSYIYSINIITITAMRTID